MCPKRKNSFAKYIILIFILFICLAAYIYKYLSAFNQPSTVGEGKINTKAVKRDEPVNFLLMGVDVGDPKSKSKYDPKRTDTLILVNYNSQDGKINIISIPRDTLIRINGRNQKINAAHAIGGVNYAIEAVEKLLDVGVNFYGKVDYKGFREIIDAIGGIDIKINNRMDYDDPSQNLSIHFKKGEVVHLDGEKAEEFFRWRKNNDGTGLADGDIGRIENQHVLIEKVIEKMKNPASVAKVLPVIPEYVTTNMKPEEIIKYSYVISRIEKENISISTIKGTTDYIDEISYFIYDEKANNVLLEKIHGIQAKTDQ